MTIIRRRFVAPFLSVNAREETDDEDARAAKRERETDAKAELCMLFEAVLVDTLKKANYFEDIAPAANSLPLSNQEQESTDFR
jgi:hypothetical protein